MHWIQHLIIGDYHSNTTEYIYIYIYIGHGFPFTNIRYSDDIILYAKSLNELEEMTQKFGDELRKIGLHLNAKKTKIIRP